MSTQMKDPYLRHLFDGDPAWNVYSKGVINLSVGAPGPDLLQKCTSLLAKATKHRLEEEEKEGKYYLFQYGATPGLWECREELAKFLTRRYGDPVARENLILTCGATHGLQLILTSILAPDAVIFVDDVTYMIALEAFKQFPLKRVISVPMKNDVVDLDALEILVKQETLKTYSLGNDKIFWAMYYTVPTFHNPTGMSISPDMCQRLVKMARENSFTVVCDDVYNLLHYQAEYPPHRLFNYDNPKDLDYCGGNVISNGSFSKILSPAIRVGWLECGPRVVNILKESGVLKSGGAVNHYVSGLIASILHLKLEDEYLDNLIKIYKERMTALCDVLDRNLPRNCSYRHPQGGYFVWIKLPEELDSLPFMKWCQEVHKVSAIPGARFSNHGKSKNYIRVSIAFHNVENIRKAALLLCNAITEYAKVKSSL
ncbi:2-aminoadipate transaminase-like isoform X3 [Phymastichus coffea]|nr:2-aminoadipate transaminase-like isoform X3 [Phymastichus coffea]